jgi:hypothetical protein
LLDIAQLESHERQSLADVVVQFLRYTFSLQRFTEQHSVPEFRVMVFLADLGRFWLTDRVVHAGLSFSRHDDVAVLRGRSITRRGSFAHTCLDELPGARAAPFEAGYC